MWHKKQSLPVSNLFYQPPPSPCLPPVWPPPPKPTGPWQPLSPSSAPLLCIVVTVQIYLSRSAKRTGTSGSLAASAVTYRSATDPQQQTSESGKASAARKASGAKVPSVRKPPSISLQLRKSGSLSSYSLDTPSYRSPVKSPSQYFQICY